MRPTCNNALQKVIIDDNIANSDVVLTKFKFPKICFWIVLYFQLLIAHFLISEILAVTVFSSAPNKRT